MQVPLSWLREYVDLPPAETGRSVADRLVRAGLEVEAVEVLGADLTGPVVVGVVRDVEELTGFKKPIRYCKVDVGEDVGPRGIVCGAANFSVGDRVVVALPGAVLPGGFAVSARRTYGRTSDGMICSARELGSGTDATGILVLTGPPGDAPPGTDAVRLLGLRDEVLHLAVTPDRGYCLSMRGIARETATGYHLPFADPAAVDVPVGAAPGYPVVVEDPAGCSVFVALTVGDIDPAAPSPPALQERLHKGGMRSISLTVDVTNAVMLELGQPLHAYDRAALQGPIRVRRARAGEQLATLDGVKRDLDPDDLVITDDSGPIGLAGVMGGASTEISAGTRSVVLEAAHFDPISTGRTARRHRLASEASRRFERGVDPALQLAAARRAAELLVTYGGGQIDPDVTVLGAPAPPPTLTIAADLPGRVAGYPYPPARVTALLEAVGCVVEPYGEGDDKLDVTPPTWRPDLTDPFDLVEEVARLHGYDAIPSVLPTAPPGHGLTVAQRRRRQVDRAMAAAGYVETPCYPFVGPADWDALSLPADDPRRRGPQLVNPLREEEPQLRTSLLPGLLGALRRNLARGATDVALFETGQVFLAQEGAADAPRLGVDRPPNDEELAALEAALPRQPRHVAAVLAGHREPPGWWGAGRLAGWADAIEGAREVGRALGVGLTVRAADVAPWHPGRCAEVRLADGADTADAPDVADVADGQDLAGLVVGHAGELHPRVVAALGLPAGTSAMELDLDVVVSVADPADQGPRAPGISPYPVATQDVALVVPDHVPAAEVQTALAAGAGPLLESIRLFDIYTGDSIPTGHRSLAYALRFRAPDRTLTVEEASAARAAAVTSAARRTGAVPRGG